MQKNAGGKMRTKRGGNVLSLVEKRHKNKAETERKKNKMKEREKLRIWDPARCNQMRIQILGGSSLIVNRMNRKMED